MGGNEQKSGSTQFQRTGDSRINRVPAGGFNSTSDVGYTQGEGRFVNDPRELQNLIDVLRRVGIFDLALPPEKMRAPVNHIMPSAASMYGGEDISL